MNIRSRSRFGTEKRQAIHVVGALRYDPQVLQAGFAGRRIASDGMTRSIRDVLDRMLAHPRH